MVNFFVVVALFFYYHYYNEQEPNTFCLEEGKRFSKPMIKEVFIRKAE